jgi:hypothetical protein
VDDFNLRRVSTCLATEGDWVFAGSMEGDFSIATGSSLIVFGLN